MCLVVLGRHVDQLKFLEVMFGDEPPLTPAELIYQRMLARDPVEAADQARIFLKEKPLAGSSQLSKNNIHQKISQRSQRLLILDLLLRSRPTSRHPQNKALRPLRL